MVFPSSSSLLRRLESKEICQWKKPSDLDISFPTSSLQQLHEGGGGCGGDVGGQMLIEREGEVRSTVTSLLLVFQWLEMF